MSLDELRGDIDRLDASLVRLLNERAGVASAIAEEKLQEGLPLYDGEREAVVYERIRVANDGPLSDGDLRSIYERVIAACREVERRRGGAELEA